jgi:uncharacterized protein (TIGR04255 family)
MLEQAALEEVFPSNPLREVVFEIRFDLNLRIFPQIFYIQEDTAAEYPTVSREQGLVPDMPGLATSYVFQNPEAGRTIRIWENKITVATTKYDTFENFSKEALSRTQSFCSLFKIKRLTRVGLRYVNNVAMPLETVPHLLNEYIAPYFKPVTVPQADLLQYKTEAISFREKCMLGVRTGLGSVSDDGAVYVLDLDAFVNEGNPKDLRATMIDLHHQVQYEFLSRITDAYKEVMRRPK